jgi:hypothetical protein
MNRENLIKGLTILGKYDQTGYGVAAEHDAIYGGDTEGVSEEDAAELRALGWTDQEDPSLWVAFV